MSASTRSRVVRNPPKRKFTESTYRKAKPFLLRDFDGRCAYSLQHYERVGYKCMEVDHFNPNLRGPARHDYSNLFPATRHCNGSKSDLWPAAKLRKAGVRFLNPTKEVDYGVHIFEDPVSNELVGTSPAGIFHIRCCDLNAPHLVLERRDRAKLRALLNEYCVTTKAPLPVLDGKQVLDASSILRAIVERMIPPIPTLP
jgi:hypothetical protein